VNENVAGSSIEKATKNDEPADAPPESLPEDTPDACAAPEATHHDGWSDEVWLACANVDVDPDWADDERPSSNPPNADVGDAPALCAFVPADAEVVTCRASVTYVAWA
jgi:hypothetical protein